MGPRQAENGPATTFASNLSPCDVPLKHAEAGH